MASPAHTAHPSLVPVRGSGIDWRLIAQLITLLVLTCVCYWPALNGEFQWDDNVLIKDNELVQSWSGLHDIWASTKPFDYFPLTYTSFWLEWPLWGADPTGYHLVNLALHLTAACLLWRLLKAMELPGAWLGALLFAIHPVNVASVAWIAERKNTLSMVFYLACLLSFWHFGQACDRRNRWRRYSWALGFFVLAALSKASVVMLPFVLLLICWWRSGRVSWMDLIRSVPFFFVSLASGLATMWFQYHRAMDPALHDDGKLSLPLSILLSAQNAWFYLGKALLPVRLSMLYPRHVPGFDLWSLVMVVGWIGLLGAAWAGRRYWGRGPLTLLLYFLVTMVPVAGILHMSFYSFSYVSDHLVHLSLVGIIVGVSCALGAWQRMAGINGRLAIAVSAVVVVLCGLATVQRAEQFSTVRRLWENTRAIAPHAYAVYNNLGVEAQDHGHLAEAEADYREAMRLEPRSMSAANNLANTLRMQGKWREAADLYKAILRLDANAQCCNNLGVVYMELGDVPDARQQFQRALTLDRTMDKAWFNLYRVEKSEGNLVAAGDALRRMLRINPNDASALSALALLGLEATGEDSPTASASLGPALVLAERACQASNYQNTKALAALSKILFAMGKRGEAAATAKRALVVANESHQMAFAASFAPFADAMAEAK